MLKDGKPPVDCGSLADCKTVLDMFRVMAKARDQYFYCPVCSKFLEPSEVEERQMITRALHGGGWAQYGDMHLFHEGCGASVEYTWKNEDVLELLSIIDGSELPIS